MSYELIGSETRACWCGKGTVVFHTEMDDWNRMRHHKEINCEYCRRQHQDKINAETEKKALREELYQRAKSLAESRYLQTWLDRYAGLSKIDAWRLYTGGAGYPSLGTFRKHVKEDGMTQYFRRAFNHQFEDALERLGVIDPEINKLLAQMELVDK